MRNYTQQTDRIRDQTLMTRAIKEVKEGMFIQPLLNELFYYFFINCNYEILQVFLISKTDILVN